MSHQNLNFEEATRQVANLMAATGQNVSAYEDESAAPKNNSFEAAFAAVEAAEQHADRCQSAPTSRNLSFEMGQIAEDGHYEPSPEESRFRFPEEEVATSPKDYHDQDEDLEGLEAAMRRIQAPNQTTIPHQQVEQEVADEDDFGMCATEIDDSDLLPDVIDPEVYSFSNVVECAGTLEYIWKAFVGANLHNRPQQAVLPDRTLNMTRCSGGEWQIRDEVQGLWYLQAGENDVQAQVALERGDLFIWVIPIIEGEDPSFVDDLGYIHNGYIFMRRGENAVHQAGN